ncbi:MAG: hypothetical protein MJZ21_01485, partial [archaeon]|nr:hypothetical protein [archaeon]
GIAIAPHPFSVHVDGMQEKILELPIEGFEVINGGHPDIYSNYFAKKVMDLFPGRWAETSGSDAHSVHTAGYNWTEFPGRSEDDFRNAILNKTTVGVGEPAPVLAQVQWSMQVVWGGQKLMYKALRRKLEPVPENELIAKCIRNSDIKNATGIMMGFIYDFPFTSMLATLISTGVLKHRAKVAMKTIDQRLESIQKFVNEMDAKRAMKISGEDIAPLKEAISEMDEDDVARAE